MNKVLSWLITILFLLAIGLGFLAIKNSQAQKGNSVARPDNIGYGEASDQQRDKSSNKNNISSPVPILMYHYIRDYQAENDPLGIQLSVSPATFEQQLQTLIQAGYQTISLARLATRQYPAQSFILTFDDGYLDQFQNAWPLLQKYSLTATFFIVSDFVGKDGYMNQLQIDQLRSNGMEIGGHSVHHKNLAKMEYEQEVEEIAPSLRDTAPIFAYPSGQFNVVTLDILSGLGVKAAVTTNLGVANEKSDLLQLPRIRVKEKTDLLKVINEEISLVKKSKTTLQQGE